MKPPRSLTHAPLAAIAIAVAVPAQVTDWVQLSPPLRPPARQNGATAFDHVRGVTVMFGGWSGTQRLNDTWEWNGTLWTQINTPNSPTPRDGMALAFDSTRQVVVCTAGYVAPGETWEYDGTDWTQVVTANMHALGAHRRVRRRVHGSSVPPVPSPRRSRPLASYPAARPARPT